MRQRITFAVLCLVCLCGVQAQHIEFKWHGLYGVVEFDHLSNLNRDDHEVALNGVSAVVGWQVRKESAIGLGFSYLGDPTGAFSQMPVFVELRSHYLRSRLTPFTVAQAGYSFPTNSASSGSEAVRIEKGGMMFAFAVGGRYAVSRTLGVNLHVGYQLLLMNEVERRHAGAPTDRSSQLLHNVKVGLGLNF
ncbi:MAG: hypothetical protein AUK63_450 [bacterium P3]|nr:MAG: hypothetical protein AUK63_450 [bacterium P3]KWW41906.1 MAG: hypothetical protein F083_557 [bacterium F083]